MRKANRFVAITVAGTIACGGVIAGAAHADLLGSVVKGGLIAVLIKQFAGPINDGVNKITGSAGVSSAESTKVVPIISVGQGSYVGAAQVSGPQESLDNVKAVGMLEGSVSGDRFRLKALVPIDTTSPKGVKLTRIKGVGVSAIVDIKV